MFGKKFHPNNDRYRKIALRAKDNGLKNRDVESTTLSGFSQDAMFLKSARVYDRSFLKCIPTIATVKW